jgi:hypothetical protein
MRDDVEMPQGRLDIGIGDSVKGDPRTEARGAAKKPG